jgi:integrase
LPAFGKKHLDEITRTDIIKVHQGRLDAGGAPGSANRLLIMMRYIYNLACNKWFVPGVRDNPTKGIPLFEENNKKERYLSADEIKRLHAAVKSSQNTMLQYIIPMLILTGARKQEVLKARWDEFDFDARSWRIPMTKSGKARHVPLSDQTLVLLAEIQTLQLSDTFVFPNRKTGKPYVSIFCAWDTARKHADLADVRIHDLRHTFASLLVNSGRTLYEVQKLLGHTQVKTTQRYAHLAHDTLIDASNAATTSLGDVFKLKGDHKVIHVLQASKEIFHADTNHQAEAGTLSTLQEMFGTAVPTVPMEERNHAES